VKTTRKPSILIVDDESSNVEALLHILPPEYAVYVVTSGAEAIEVAEKLLPDIVLLDIVMPEVDGYAVIAALKESEKTREIPVIFLTGLSSADDEEKGLALGAADYISKPFSPGVVKLRVANQIKILRQRMAEDDIMKYKLTCDTLGIGLWDVSIASEELVNPNNRFAWSQEFRRLLGFSDEHDGFPDFLHSWSDRLHPEDQQKTLEALAAHIADYTGKTPYDVEYRLMLKSGEYRHFHSIGTALRDSGGVPFRVVGALMDITEKKLAMERVVDEAQDIAWLMQPVLKS